MEDNVKHRERQLLVIGAGVGRTGTRSLQEALTVLGFPCYNGYEIGKKGVPEIEKWVPILQAKRRQIMEKEELKVEAEDWQALFHDYKAAVDFPACIFYKELKKLYPRAKVILTVRSRESWYASARDTIAGSFTNRRYHFANTVCGWFDPFTKAFSEHIDGEIFLVWKLLEKGVDNPFLGLRNAELMMQCYDEHTRDVRKHIDEKDLLVMNINEGWSPLCNFLGVRVPMSPFPQCNDRNDFLRMREKMFCKALLIFFVPICLGITLIIILAFGSLPNFNIRLTTYT